LSGNEIGFDKQEAHPYLVLSIARVEYGQMKLGHGVWNQNWFIHL